MLQYDRAALKAQARASLSKKWGLAILVCFLAAVILGMASSLVVVGSLVVAGPIAVGLAIFFSRLVRGEGVKIDNLFDGLNHSFGNSLVAGLIHTILISLGCLVIVPGVLLSLGWSQYSYLIREDPELDGWQCLNESYELMRGHKGEYFMLLLSFLGWYCLVILSLGLAWFYVTPYVAATKAAYFDYLKAAKLEEGGAVS